jgi:ABC-2 type transport system ATP-binding protein
LRHKTPNSFSSGQKKKILLAQALIHDPDIIIMDEPVANLDPKARTEFFSLLIDLRKKRKAIFISSHVLAELDRYADSATILDGGKIIYSGDKKTLMNKFSTHRYEIATSNDVITKKYLKAQHLKHYSNDANDAMVVNFATEDKAITLQKELIKNGITFTKFSRIEPSLDQVYSKLVIKGSVDTEKG